MCKTFIGAGISLFSIIIISGSKVVAKCKERGVLPCILQGAAQHALHTPVEIGSGRPAVLKNPKT
jgi:hypothetical protein